MDLEDQRRRAWPVCGFDSGYPQSSGHEWYVVKGMTERWRALKSWTDGACTEWSNEKAPLLLEQGVKCFEGCLQLGLAPRAKLVVGTCSISAPSTSWVSHDCTLRKLMNMDLRDTGERWERPSPECIWGLSESLYMLDFCTCYCLLCGFLRPSNMIISVELLSQWQRCQLVVTSSEITVKTRDTFEKSGHYLTREKWDAG